MPAKKDRIIATAEKVGYLVMKDGKAWGVDHGDAHYTHYDWIDATRPSLCGSEDHPLKNPTDITYKTDHNRDEIATGKVVKVRRTIIIEEIA